MEDFISHYYFYLLKKAVILIVCIAPKLWKRNITFTEQNSEVPIAMLDKQFCEEDKTSLFTIICETSHRKTIHGISTTDNHKDINTRTQLIVLQMMKFI